MHLYLIGLPAAGKTTLGRRLAAHYGREFVDLDAVITAAAGQDIPAIFAAEGEAGFRQREAAAVREVASRPGPLVVATGGGAPCFHGNMAVLQATGLTVWLDVPLPTLVRRLAAGGWAGGRPLVAPPDPNETPENSLKNWLTRTLAARREFYAQARLRCRGVAGTQLAAVVAALGRAGFPGS
ncbi:MAG: shikimate kinase [Janthinobacterium lividum]